MNTCGIQKNWKETEPRRRKRKPMEKRRARKPLVIEDSYLYCWNSTYLWERKDRWKWGHSVPQPDWVSTIKDPSNPSNLTLYSATTIPPLFLSHSAPSVIFLHSFVHMGKLLTFANKFKYVVDTDELRNYFELFFAYPNVTDEVNVFIKLQTYY